MYEIAINFVVDKNKRLDLSLSFVQWMGLQLLLDIMQWIKSCVLNYEIFCFAIISVKISYS